MSNKTQELIKVLAENPDRELIFMYPEEGSGWYYTLGYPTNIILDEYTTHNERIWLKGENYDELFEDISDDVFNYLFPYQDYTDEEEDKLIESVTEERIEKLDWKKCICVYIGY